MATDRPATADPYEAALADLREKLAAKRAVGMILCEVVVVQAARFHEHHRKRIAEDEHDGRARCRREIDGARFTVHVGVEDDIAVLCERARGVACDRDEPCIDSAQMRQKIEQLLCLAGIAEHDDDVAFIEHAEVAVQSVLCVEIHAGRAGAVERRGKFARDVSALADAADDSRRGCPKAGGKPYALLWLDRPEPQPQPGANHDQPKAFWRTRGAGR